MLGLLMLGSAYAFAIPSDRWVPSPTRNVLPSDYQPCYSGSGRCN